MYQAQNFNHIVRYLIFLKFCCISHCDKICNNMVIYCTMFYILVCKLHEDCEGPLKHAGVNKKLDCCVH